MEEIKQEAPKSLWDGKPVKTEDEIKQLALDLHSGKIFTDRHVTQENMMMSVFMPLGFGAFSGIEEAEMLQIGMIYEYLDKAGPRSVNGYPTFTSLQYLHKDDCVRLFDKYKKIEEAVANI